MVIGQQGQIDGKRHAVFHQHPPVDNCQVHRLGLAEDERRHRVVDRTAGVGERVQIEGDDVRGHTRCEAADVVPAQDRRTAQGGNLQGFPCSHRFGVAQHPLQQEGLAHFGQQVAAVVGGAAVHAQADRHSRVPHSPHRSNAAAQAHIAGGAVGHAGVGLGKVLNFRLVQMDAVGVPYVVAGPAQFLRVVTGSIAELFQTEGFFVLGFGQMGVQVDIHPGAKGAGQGRALPHQIGRDAEGAARRNHHPAHGKAAGVVEILHHPATVV